MEENTNFLSYDAVDTIPEALGEKENVTNDNDNIVTPDNNENYQENVTRDTDSQRAQMSVSEAVSEPFVSVQYNHKNRDFTKDEAIKLIQKGMHTESLRNKLEFLAKKQGVDVNSLVDTLVLAPENAYRNYLENLYGKGHENVEIGMKIYREKQSDEYKKLISDIENTIKQQEKNNSINSRLADEYIELKNQVENAPEYSDLPDSVIMEAVQGKRDLYSAYLCYLNEEKQKIDAETKSREASNAAALGKMSNTYSDTISSAERGFLSGLWSK